MTKTTNKPSSRREHAPAIDYADLNSTGNQSEISLLDDLLDVIIPPPPTVSKSPDCPVYTFGGDDLVDSEVLTLMIDNQNQILSTKQGKDARFDLFGRQLFDPTGALGRGKFKEPVAKSPTGKPYKDFVKKIFTAVNQAIEILSKKTHSDGEVETPNPKEVKLLEWEACKLNAANDTKARKASTEVLSAIASNAVSLESSSLTESMQSKLKNNFGKQLNEGTDSGSDNDSSSSSR